MSFSIDARGIITVLPTTRRGRGTRAAEHEDEVSASFSADRTLVVTVSDPARAEHSFALRAQSFRRAV